MKLLRITSVYPDYPRQFYMSYPGLAEKSFEEQKRVFDFDAYAWADSWKVAMEPLGYEVMEIAVNVGPLQEAWARENLPRRREKWRLNEIAIEQIKGFGPDTLWFDDHDAALLKRIRESAGTIKTVLGWTGSALPSQNAFPQCDAVLSCSRESIEILSSRGCRTAELHHGFDPRVIERLNSPDEDADAIFIGQLIRGRQFHDSREKLLESLVEHIPLQIFSPSRSQPAGSGIKRLAKSVLRKADAGLKMAGAGETTKKLLKAVGRDEDWLAASPATPNQKLLPYMRDGVYGLKMYQSIRNSKITLNIHADSSDRYASNMRLYEVSGVATCLLTDWKQNVGDFFEDGKEVVTYKSSAECIEKAKWLLSHPDQCAAIGLAGQARTLKDHTFSQRAHRLDEIIRSLCSKPH